MPRKISLIWLISSFLFGTFLITSCEYEFVVPEEVVIPEVVSFSEDIIPIFNSSCNTSGCHVSGFGILDLSPGNAYDDLFRKNLIDVDNPDQSKLYTKLIEPNGTHAGRSTPTDQATILEWIVKGAKNN